MERIIKMARVIDKVLSVLWVLLIVAAAVSVTAMLLGVIFAESIMSWSIIQLGGTTTLSSGMLKITVQEPALAAGDFRALCGSLAFVILLACALSLYAIRLFKGIMGELKEGRPFSETMPARIRKAAVLVFVYAFITPIIPSIPVYYFLRMFDLQSISSALSIVNSTLSIVNVEHSFQYEANLFAVIIGFMVLLLALVFEYGAKLQRESDEML